MSELDKPYNPKDHEDRIYKIWEDSGYFNPDNLAISAKPDAPSYSMVIPPPNITGSLHMGHALNATIQDILIRYHRMNGYKTLWLPGTDHAGIATQYVVEKELKKEGKTRFDLGREKFLERIWEWREKYGNTILDQLKKLGASCDWSRARFTLDEKYTKAVETAFKHYYDKGLIYQADRVVNWCSRCATSLSDLEAEYQEEESELIFIKYQFADGSGHITVATTRPETMLGDSAVAVNPKDERYKKLVGRKVMLPIQDREIPVIVDDAVDMEFGTGAVKVTPAHDTADFEMHERHNLPVYKIIDEKGRMTEEAGKEFKGMKILECREAVVKKLNGLGLIEKTEKFTHNISKCYRCGTVIEPLISKQWFLKMKDLAKSAIAAVESGEVKFHPENFKKTYTDWLSNIRDWAISRQLWWGHKIPIWYNRKLGGPHQAKHFNFESFLKKIDMSDYEFRKATNEWDELPDYAIVGSQNIQIGMRLLIQLKNRNLIDDEWITKNEIKQPTFLKEEIQYSVEAPANIGWEQESSVLDTWFSSALWPFATLGWPEKTKDLEDFYPTQVLSTARDIINLWVARMIYSGLEFTGKKPFSDVIIHATVLNKEGKRMSKSLGTGIDPLQLIDQYGADATRFALIWQSMGGQDMKWQQEAVIAGKKLLNKMWNATRFVLQRTGNSKSEILNPKQISNLKLQIKENEEILEKFENIKQETSKLIENYEFGQALHALYDFFWHNYCDEYLEASKKSESQETNQTLIYVLAGTIKLFHPFIPFATETLWEKIPIKDKKLLIVENW